MQQHKWLKALKKQLDKNFEYAVDFIRDNIPELRVISGDATYLMWMILKKLR